jgi:hypothetical protein
MVHAVTREELGRIRLSIESTRHIRRNLKTAVETPPE